MSVQRTDDVTIQRTGMGAVCWTDELKAQRLYFVYILTAHTTDVYYKLAVQLMYTLTV